MKINWFSPLPPAKIDIATYTFELLPALQNHYQLKLWTNESNWNKEIEQYGDVCHYRLDSIPWAEINQADLNIYHIGNNPHLYGAIWQVSRQCPGLVVLHDFKLQDFFYRLYRETLNDQIGYLTQMKKYYGTDGETAAKQFWHGLISTETMAKHYPLTYAALSNAVGVIVHTRQAYKTLQQEDRWLVGYIPLPYAKTGQSPEQSQANKNLSSQLYSKMIVDIIEKTCALKSLASSKYLIEKVREKISPWGNSALINVDIRQMAEAIKFISF